MDDRDEFELMILKLMEMQSEVTLLAVGLDPMRIHGGKSTVPLDPRLLGAQDRRETAREALIEKYRKATAVSARWGAQ